MTFQEEKKIYLQFPLYQLEEPNDCNFNFIQIFDEKTDIEHRKRYFCGSVAEAYQSETDVLFIRYKKYDYNIIIINRVLVFINPDPIINLANI